MGFGKTESARMEKYNSETGEIYENSDSDKNCWRTIKVKKKINESFFFILYRNKIINIDAKPQGD